jgi:hypothetical protein
MDFRYLWRDAMASKDGPEKLVRLILFGLETFMDGNAECYPSTRILADRTGCNRTTVERCLRRAEKAGWIEIIERSRQDGQAWRRHKYRGKIPANLQKVDDAVNHVGTEGGVHSHPPLPKKVDDGSTKVDDGSTKGGLPRQPEPTNNQPKNQPIDNIRRKSVSVVKKKAYTGKAISPVAVELSQHLLDAILLNHPGFKKPNLTSWAKHTELMLRRDSRTPDDIRAVATWCQQDQFWKANVLSTRTLRDKFDRLYIQMKESNNGQHRGSATFKGNSRKGSDAGSCPSPEPGKYASFSRELPEDG